MEWNQSSGRSLPLAEVGSQYTGVSQWNQGGMGPQGDLL